MSLEELQKQHDKIEAENQSSYDQWLAETGLQMDTRDLRLNIALDHLFPDPEERLKFEIAFHLEVKRQLDEQWAKWREHKAKTMLAVPKKKPGLVDGQGRPLTR